MIYTEAIDLLPISDRIKFFKESCRDLIAKGVPVDALHELIAELEECEMYEAAKGVKDVVIPILRVRDKGEKK